MQIKVTVVVVEVVCTVVVIVAFAQIADLFVKDAYADGCLRSVVALFLARRFYSRFYLQIIFCRLFVFRNSGVVQIFLIEPPIGVVYKARGPKLRSRRSFVDSIGVVAAAFAGAERQRRD